MCIFSLSICAVSFQASLDSRQVKKTCSLFWTDEACKWSWHLSWEPMNMLKTDAKGIPHSPCFSGSTKTVTCFCVLVKLNVLKNYSKIRVWPLKSHMCVDAVFSLSASSLEMDQGELPQWALNVKVWKYAVQRFHTLLYALPCEEPEREREREKERDKQAGRDKRTKEAYLRQN